MSDLEAPAWSHKTLHFSPPPSNSGGGQALPPTAYNAKQWKREDFSTFQYSL